MFLFRIRKTQLSVKLFDFFEFWTFLSRNFVTFRLNEFLQSCGANIDMNFIVQKKKSVRDSETLEFIQVLDYSALHSTLQLAGAESIFV